MKKKFLFLLLFIFLSFNVYGITNRTLVLNFNNPTTTDSFLYSLFPQTNLTYVSPSITALNRLAYYPNTPILYISYWTNLYNGSSNLIDRGNFWIQYDSVGMNSTSFSSATGGRYDCLDVWLNDTYYMISNNKINIMFNKYGCTSGNCNGQDVFVFYDDIILKGNKPIDGGSYAVSYNITRISTLSENISFNRFSLCGGEATHSGTFFSLVSQINITYAGLTGNERNLNEMPIVGNITLNNNSIMCMGKNDTEKEFSLNFTSSDYENDTIYYSIGKINKNTHSYYIDFQKEKCITPLLCIPYPAYSTFISNVYSNNGLNCEFNTSQYYQDNNDDNIIVWDNALQEYVLRLSNLCDGQKTFDYILNLPLDNLYYSTTIYDLDHESHFNISFYGDTKTKLLNKFRIQRNLTRLLVYSYNDTEILNVTYLEPISFFIEEHLNGSTTFKFFGTINTTAEFKTLATNSSNYLISLDYNDFNLYMEKFIYTGYENIYNFTTTKPSSFIADRIGVIVLRLYYTDSVHLNRENSYIDYPINVLDCESPYNINTQVSEPIETLGIFYRNSCSTTNNIINGFNYSNNKIDFCLTLYYIYIIFTLILSIAIGGYIYVSIGSPDLAFGLSCFIMSGCQILVYRIFLFSNMFKILWGLIFAFGIGALIITIVSRKSG